MTRRLVFSIRSSTRPPRRGVLPLDGPLSIGADAHCQLVLDGPGVAGVHLMIVPGEGDIRLVAVGSAFFTVGDTPARFETFSGRGELGVGSHHIALQVIEHLAEGPADPHAALPDAEDCTRADIEVTRDDSAEQRAAQPEPDVDDTLVCDVIPTLARFGATEVTSGATLTSTGSGPTSLLDDDSLGFEGIDAREDAAAETTEVSRTAMNAPMSRRARWGAAADARPDPPRSRPTTGAVRSSGLRMMGALPHDATSPTSLEPSAATVALIGAARAADEPYAMPGDTHPASTSTSSMHSTRALSTTLPPTTEAVGPPPPPVGPAAGRGTPRRSSAHDPAAAATIAPDRALPAPSRTARSGPAARPRLPIDAPAPALSALSAGREQADTRGPPMLAPPLPIPKSIELPWSNHAGRDPIDRQSQVALAADTPPADTPPADTPPVEASPVEASPVGAPPIAEPDRILRYSIFGFITHLIAGRAATDMRDRLAPLMVFSIATHLGFLAWAYAVQVSIDDVQWRSRETPRWVVTAITRSEEERAESPEDRPEPPRADVPVEPPPTPRPKPPPPIDLPDTSKTGEAPEPEETRRVVDTAKQVLTHGIRSLTRKGSRDPQRATAATSTTGMSDLGARLGPIGPRPQPPRDPVRRPLHQPFADHEPRKKPPVKREEKEEPDLIAERAPRTDDAAIARDAKLIQDVLRRRVPLLRGCYETALERSKGAIGGGRVVIRLSVDAKGEPLDVRIESPDAFEGSEIIDCIENVIMRTRFERATHEIAPITYPIQFVPPS